MGGTLVDLELGAFDQLGGAHAGGDDGDDLVVVAVEDERGNVEFLQIFCTV